MIALCTVTQKSIPDLPRCAPSATSITSGACEFAERLIRLLNYDSAFQGDPTPYGALPLGCVHLENFHVRADGGGSLPWHLRVIGYRLGRGEGVDGVHLA